MNKSVTKAKDIRLINQHLRFRNRTTMSWLISCRLSPFFSAWFVNNRITPNQVTLMMILSGLLGSILFSLPILICKIVGAVFIQLWFVFDLSDGEVARYSKQYSKYGTEMDFMAHVINHPFFIVSFLLCFRQLYDIEWHKLCILFGVFLVSEFWARSTVSFYNIIENDRKKNIGFEPLKNNKNNGCVRNIISYVRGNIWAFPNYVLIFPFLYGLDALFHTTYFLYLTALIACLQIIDNLRQIIHCLIQLYKG